VIVSRDIRTDFSHARAAMAAASQLWIADGDFWQK
jgi:hypothetical protein